MCNEGLILFVVPFAAEFLHDRQPWVVVFLQARLQLQVQLGCRVWKVLPCISTDPKTSNPTSGFMFLAAMDLARRDAASRPTS